MSAPTVTLHHGDSRTVLADLADCSVHAIVTDPPYELGFMGKTWDSTGIAYSVALWQACLRVLKPGGHLLAFGGTRTWHRLAVAVEDAGFEIRDSIAWLYGSGFPKSLDVSKAIDKAAGAERETIGRKVPTGGVVSSAGSNFRDDGWEPDKERLLAITAPATPEAVQWHGWGTALKPAFEPVVVGRKPLTGTVAGNVLVHGVGALNIDATRIGTDETLSRAVSGGGSFRFDGFATLAELETAAAAGGVTPTGRDAAATLARYIKFRDADRIEPQGRWPANVVLDESQADALDQMSGIQKDGVSVNRNRNADETANKIYGARGKDTKDAGYGGSGGASRFFYVAKAPAKERPKVDGVAHPTVKPLTLMRWLIRLVTPPGGTILDPFAGSGTTAEAALTEGFHFTGIDSDPIALAMIRVRLHRQILTLDRYTGPDTIPTVTHPGDPTLFDQETV